MQGGGNWDEDERRPTAVIGQSNKSAESWYTPYSSIPLWPQTDPFRLSKAYVLHARPERLALWVVFKFNASMHSAFGSDRIDKRI